MPGLARQRQQHGLAAGARDGLHADRPPGRVAADREHSTSLSASASATKASTCARRCARAACAQA
ncbi:hypothetical protein, partial [Bordetella pertussis]|uniref:hypothetical protein n=1 Tax=Bordetella pertussis TaxID=520 RepID=UPI001C9E5220